MKRRSLAATRDKNNRDNPQLVDTPESRMMTGQIEAHSSSTILVDGCKFLRVPDVPAVCLWEPE